MPRATSRSSASPGSAEEAAADPGPASRRRLLDGRLPDGSGIDVCRDVRSVDPTIAALILTSYDDDEALFAAIMAGAAGYVLKQMRGQRPRRRRSAGSAAGQSMLDPAVTQRVLDRLRSGPPRTRGWRR